MAPSRVIYAVSELHRNSTHDVDGEAYGLAVKSLSSGISTEHR